MHKTNVLTFAGDLWRRVVAEEGAIFPEVEVDYQHVDAACIYLVEDPARYGIIVTDNLLGTFFRTWRCGHRWHWLRGECKPEPREDGCVAL